MLYEVGPSKPYASLGGVPWSAIKPGDTIQLYWSATPYKDKIVLCFSGTPDAKITLKGVPGPSGELPIIDGQDSKMISPTNFWNGNRCALKIGGSNNPVDTMPSFIVVDGIDFRGARGGYSFTDRDGVYKQYDVSAAGIYIEKGRNITVRNCILHNNGQGIATAWDTQDCLIEGNYLYGNGQENSTQQHNIYTEGTRIVIQNNRFGSLRPTCAGNNIKDRSCGCIIRYNWIEGGNRQLDLVDSDNAIINTNPSYRSTFVYGNVLIEPPNEGNSQLVHYGGDSGNLSFYRKGTLYLYNNTFFSRRTDNTTLCRLSSSGETADIRNNIVYSIGPLAILDADGVVNMRNNWLKSGWRNSFSSSTTVVADLGGNIAGANPGFVDDVNLDLRLSTSSPCINKGTNLATGALVLDRQYVKHQLTEERPICGLVDIGAYETIVPVGYRVYAVEFALKVSNDLTGADEPMVVFVMVKPGSGAEEAVAKAKDLLATQKFPASIVTGTNEVGVGLTA